MTQRIAWTKVRGVLIAALFGGLIGHSALAQTSTPQEGTTRSTSDILRELDAMKQHIAQLEAELRSKAKINQTPAAAVAAPVAPEPGEQAPPPESEGADTKAAEAPASPVAGPIPTPPPTPVPAPAPAQPQNAVPPAAPPAPTYPEALQNPDPSPAVDNETPFAFANFDWLNGNSRSGPVLDTKFFTPEIRFDTHYITSFNQPVDHTMGGSTESFRSGEFQLEQVSVGGDFHWQNVRGRILTMFGLFATTTPRNDASSGPATSGPGNGVGQWDLRNAYRYISEGWGGYHFNVNHGLNVDAGIFVSYIGLFSYYNFDNWTYQPSYVSSNTPWFFNGLRIQWFPTNKLKIEPWIINGWQSYARFNGHRGLGGQILYRPKEWLSLVFNNYGNGTDTLGNPGRSRIHTDDSIEVRYYHDPESKGISQMAFSLTGDAGCEYGGGVSCTGKGAPKQAFLGWMLYNRIWFKKNEFAVTLGGGMMNNPGRYLTLLPPINGADAITGSPYFTASPGDKAHMWDATATLQWMPKKYITWWGEVGYRHSDVPYFSGRGGITPPGGNNGFPGQFVCNDGTPSPTATGCGSVGTWYPDLRRGQAAISAGVMVKF
jgi:Putative beta-barrel porin-2, OmpL-like. bbp2